MRTKVENYWYSLRNGFWFVPALMSAAAIGLAYGIGKVDRFSQLNSLSFVYGGTSTGAQNLLVAIAGSMITVAGTVFSITIVSLSLMSQQFGPRVLRNFMRNVGNQIVLGTFLATFLYCVIVLREVHGGAQEFVPGVAVTLAVALAIASIAVLIYFIHHVATAIQASEIVAAVGRDLNGAIDRLFVDGELLDGELAPEAADLERVLSGAREVRTSRSGYVQAIDQQGLMDAAEACDVTIRITARPGQFLTREGTFALVAPGDRVGDHLEKMIGRAVIIGSSRTLEQDVQFAIEQLVQIALHALSPSLNDSFTAVRCVDQIGDALVHLMQKELVEVRVHRRDGKIRLMLPGLTFPGITDAALQQIRQNSAESPAVSIRLLDMLAIVAGRARTEEHRDAIERQARMIRDAAHAIPAPEDRQDVEARFDRVTEALRSSVFNRDGRGDARRTGTIRRSPA